MLTTTPTTTPTAPTLGTFPQVRALSRFFCDIGHTSQNRHDNAVEILSLQVRACFWCRRRIICTDLPALRVTAVTRAPMLPLGNLAGVWGSIEHTYPPPLCPGLALSAFL